MKNVNINNENDNNDKIKAYIKVEFSELKKKDLYEIDDSKKFITLYNIETKNQSKEKKEYPFEFDKIFLYNDSNSYIYEEICLNCIKQCYEGISFNFISFGETNSDKLYLLLGKFNKDYSNINNHGIFIRYLSDLIDKNKKYDYKIKLSSILIYEDKLIDLFNISNINNINNIYEFLSNYIKIEKDPSIINKISKNEINNDDKDKIILFLHDIINVLFKLNNKKNNIYSLSNICFIIYLEDKFEITLSTSTFLLLNGCEHLYDTNNQKFDIKDENSITETVTNTLNLQITYESIINLIKNNNYIINSNNNKYNNIERKSSKKLILKEKGNEGLSQQNKNFLFNNISKYSKLIIVLYNICFRNDIKNIKFRIIGNIKPMSEYFKITRDTLLFCSKCYKILNKANALLIEEAKKKNDLDDLNFQIKLQRKQLDTLNHTLEKKNSHINFLSKHYNTQINAIKKYFDFKEDPNAIIAEDINYEENNYIKNMKYKLRKQEKDIKEYKIKIEELEYELNKQKSISNIKINDETMINYYLSIKSGNMIKNFENKLINSLSKEKQELNETIKKKEKIIEGLKKDLNEKSKVLCNLHIINNSKKEKKEEKIQQNNEINEMNIALRNEIKRMKINEQKNIKAINEKYDSILTEKKDVIYTLQQRLNGLEEIYKKEIETLNKELVRLYEIILALINGYQNIFEGDNPEEKKLNMNKKEEFDKIIANIDKDVNYFNFSSLYKELENQNKTKQSIIESLTKENINNIQKKINNKMDSDKEIIKKDKLIISAKEMAITELNNKLLSMSHYLKEQVKENNKNKIIINSQKSTIERMKKSAFLYENLLKKKIKDNMISNHKYHSPTFVRSKLIRKNFIKDLNISNDKNKLIDNKKIIDDISLMNDRSIKSEIFDSSIKYIKKGNKFLLKKNKRPFSSDNN